MPLDADHRQGGCFIRPARLLVFLTVATRWRGTTLVLTVTEYCDDSLRGARPQLTHDATPVARLDHCGVLVRHQQFWPLFQKAACLPMGLVERAWEALSVFFPGRVHSIALSEPGKVLHRRDVLRIERASP